MPQKNDVKAAVFIGGESPTLSFRNVLLIAFVILCLALGLRQASAGGLTFGSLALSPLQIMEAIAIVNTMLFGVVYYVDLHQAHKHDEFEKNRSEPLLATLSAVFAVAALSEAFSTLIHPETSFWGVSGKPLYVSCVLASFVAFAWCDWLFAKVALQPKTTRTYWTLFMFGDFPTVLGAAFVLIFLLLDSGQRGSDTFVGSALTVQMLFADILVLMTSMNLPYVVLSRLCQNTKVEDDDVQMVVRWITIARPSLHIQIGPLLDQTAGYADGPGTAKDARENPTESGKDAP